MPSLSNSTRWRGDKPYKSEGYVYIWQPTKVFEARLNLPTATYPISALPYDGVTNGSYTDIRIGMTIMLGSAAGKDDYGRQRVSDTPTGSSIPIGRSSEGNHAGEINALDNAYITVLDLHEVWAKIPDISEDGISTKDGKSFNASTAQPPIANGGPAVIGFVDEDGELVVDFTGANSTFISPDASSLTYSWAFKDSTNGSSSTSSTPTGKIFPAGQRYVDFAVSDGVSFHVTHIPVVALNKTGEFSPIRATARSRSKRPEGQAISFEVKAADLPQADYPYGTLVIYFEDEWYGPHKGSLAGTAGRQNVKFVGWLSNEVNRAQATAKGMDYTVTLNALDVAGRLAKLPGFGQRVVNKDTPTNWQEMKSANVNRYLHHLLYWHTTALEVAPFRLSGAGANYPFMDLGSDGANLYTQIDQRARAIAHRLTCNTRGELAVKPNPQRQLPGSSTNTVIVALDERDWSAFEYEVDWHPSVHWTWGSAILASPTSVTSVFAVAPGKTPSQGEAESTSGEQLVLSQYEANWRIGKDYEHDNLVLKSMTIDLAHGGDAGIEPADMEWITLGIPVTLAGPRKVVYPAETRWLVLEATLTMDVEKKIVKQRLKLEPEVIGFEADAYTPKTVGQLPPTNPFIPIGPPYTNWDVDPTIVYPPVPFTPNLPPNNPMQPVVLDKSGNTVLIATPSDIILVLNFKAWMVNGVACNYRVVTPTVPEGYTIRHVVPASIIDPTSTKASAYCLMSDDEESIFVYCDNVNTLNPDWIGGEPLEGIYTQIETTDEPGKVYIKGSVTGLVVNDGTDATQWDVTPPGGTHSVPGLGGTVIARDGANSLTVEATNTGGDAGASYVVDIYNVNFACAIALLIGGTGSATNNSWEPCGVTSGAGWQAGIGFPCVDRLRIFNLAGNPTPFTVTISFAPDDDCLSTTTLTGLVTAYSQNYGQTFATPKLVDATAAGGGADTLKIGNPNYVGGDGKLRIAATKGASYDDYADSLPDGAQPTLILAPRYRPGGVVNNINTSTPQLVVGSSTLGGDDEDESLWTLSGSGTIYTDITPMHSGTPGTAVGPHCATFPWLSGARMALIYDFAGTRRLFTRISSTWTDRVALDDDAHYIRMRKGDKKLSELYIANGLLAMYSPNFGQNRYTQLLPSPIEGIIVSIEVFG